MYYKDKLYITKNSAVVRNEETYSDFNVQLKKII